MGTKRIDGILKVEDSIFEGGVSLASKYAKDSSVVHKGKDETITGNKTFNATNNYNGYNIFNGATNANGEKECITFPTGAILATDKELKLYTHNSYNTFGNSSGTYGLKGAANTVYDLATMVRSGEDQWSIAGRKSWSNTHAFDASVDFNGGFSSKGVGTFNNQLIANNNIYANSFIYNNKGMMGGYLELHPEANTVAFPFYMNDLAYLQKKGGSCTITGFATNDEPTNSRIFNGKSNYSHYTLNNTSDTVTILVKTHTYFSWGSSIGISFGSSNWRAKNIKIELGYATTIGGDPATDAWVTVGETTDYPEGNYFIRGVYGPTTSGDGGKKWNTIRFTLTNFNGLNIRIASIYMFNYSSEGLNTTLLGKDGGEMYGDIVPYTHDTLQLGESGNRFKIGYFRNILENEYLESNYITTNGFMPKNGNGVGHIGSTDVKWNQVHSQYIYGDTLCENNIKLEEKYIPKKSINNAYQAIVDNSNATFTVTAGLSNNTSQTKFTIAPSGIATINDKQIATTDDIPSYGNATTTTSGLMSASDKTTLTALTCKSESKDIALGLTSLIGDQTVNPITANITDRSFFSKIIDLMRAGQVVTGFYLQLGNYYTFLKLFFANLEEGYENLSFEITDANDNSCVSYGINYDASNYIITFNKRDASIADALIDDNGTTYHYNSFALSSHNQASNTINAMTNYSKPTSTSAIKATDSLNTAIGKLEKALDGKGTSNLTLGTTATTAAKGDHTHSVATTSANGLMSKEDKTKLDTISNNYVKEYSTGKNSMPGTIINNGSSIYIDSGNDSINVIGEGDEHGVSISVGDNNFVNFYQDRTEMIDAPVKIKQIQAPTASNGSKYGLGTSGQVLKSNGTSVYWANNTTYTTFTRGSTDFSPAYTLTAKDAGFIHTWWRCSSNLYASCNFGKVIAVSATNLFPMQKYSPGTNTSNQTTAYQKSVSSGSGSYSNNSSNAFQIPQRGDMVIDQYGCIGVIESDPTTVVSTYSVRLVWKSIKDWSCLEKGTQITLADGTYKNIEDVRQGESIMGWDFEKNEPCEAIALFADAAQADEKTTYLVLDNGEILSMTDGHTLYSKNLERYIPINDLREGDILMGKDGEDVEVVSIHWNIHTFGIRQFYHVVSSNNTYFANNTLNAIHPVDKYNWLQNRSSEVVPDEILAIFEQDKGEFDCFDFTIKNKEFLALTSKHQSTLKKHRNKIGDLKNYLTNTDYVAIKMFEGLEVDETILDIRKEKRKEINALEEEIEKIEKEYNNLLVQYSDLGEDMLLSDNARRSKYFKVACKNDNEHLDLFKKYYPLKDEAYILKEIEEGKANRPITEVIEEEESE